MNVWECGNDLLTIIENKNVSLAKTSAANQRNSFYKNNKSNQTIKNHAPDRLQKDIIANQRRSKRTWEISKSHKFKKICSIWNQSMIQGILIYCIFYALSSQFSKIYYPEKPILHRQPKFIIIFLYNLPLCKWINAFYLNRQTYRDFRCWIHRCLHKPILKKPYLRNYSSFKERLHIYECVYVCTQTMEV